MRFRLRTLLIVLAIGPALLGASWLLVTAGMEYRTNLERRILLDHQEMVNEGKRIKKGVPTFARP